MIGVYVKYNDVSYRLDLFQDENIDITSSQQDVTDISKVFTDYSQNFSIPATANNNKVFKYWYENALENGFDDSLKLDCIIELNGNTFRNGKLKLEKATIVNGQAKDYSVSFFGNLVSLKDKFKDDKLINVEEINSIINFEYSPENVVDLVVNENDSDIAFPLITPSRVWTWGYNTAQPTEKSTDIADVNGSIDYNELFPAVKVKSMFNAIEQKYNINFVGSFLNDKRFTELFLLAKNSDVIKFNSETKDVLFDTYTGDTIEAYTIDYDANSVYCDGGNLRDYETSMYLNVTTDPNTNWTAFIYKDGIKVDEFTSKGTNSTLIFTQSSAGATGGYGIGTYTFKFTTDGAITNAQLDFYLNMDDDPMTPGFEISLYGYLTLNVYGSSTLPINVLMPDIKVADFFSGIVKMFNLTCYSEDGVDFIIEPLNQWYADGYYVDITKFCENNWEVNKTVQYKSITFKYEKSESVINNAFYQNFQREYGDLEFKPENQDKDGQEYKVELPFENLLHSKLSSTRIQVGYNVNKDLKPYTSKPVLLYKWGNISTDVSYYIEGEHKTSYNAFGQDLEYTEGIFYTLNFRAEQSTLLNGVVENTLFNVYYSDYLSEIFLPSSRQINIKGIFDFYTISTLKLNDKVIIRDKRYKINKLDLNLNKQTFSLELITDIL